MIVNKPLDDRPPRGAEAGVTLPETLVALAILLVVSVAVLALFSYSMKLNATCWDYARLTQTGRDSAEHLVALAWTDVRLTAGTHVGEVTTDGLRVVWLVTDSRIDEATPIPPGSVAIAEANLKEITVTCSAPAGSGIGRRDVTLVVLKARD